MKEVPAGGNKRNVLHFQRLLKKQRKRVFFCEMRSLSIVQRKFAIVSISCNLASQHIAIWERQRSHNDVSASRLHANIFWAQNRKRGMTRIAVHKKAESIVTKSRQGIGMVWSLSAYMCQPFSAHLLEWLVVLVM